MNRKQSLVFAGLCLAWGSTWIASDVLAERVPPLLASSARYLLSAALCLPFLARKAFLAHSSAGFRGPLRSLQLSSRVLLLAVTMIVFPTLLLHWARSLVPSATVVVLYAAMPLIVVLLTPVFEESVAPARAMQASVAAVGGLLLATGAIFSVSQAGGCAILLLAVVSTAASSLLAQRLLTEIQPMAMTAWVLGFAGLLLGLCGLFWERGQPVAWDGGALLSLFLVALTGGALAYGAWFWLLQGLPAYQVVTVNWIAPLIALVESALLLRVPLTWQMVTGLIITLTCLLVVLRTGKEDDQNVSLRGI